MATTSFRIEVMATTDFPEGCPASQRTEVARGLARRHWTHDLSYMGLREGTEIFSTEGGEALLGLRISSGVAVGLGSPIGLESRMEAVMGAFRRWAGKRGLLAAMCGLRGEHVRAAEAAGFDVTSVGDEATVDPRDVDLRGRPWREVRASLNRSRRRGLGFRWLSKGESELVGSRLNEVARAWLDKKALPELDFAVGGVGSIRDPDARVGVAEDATRQVLGFVTWVPSKDGWMLELLRYWPGYMAGLADFLVASSLLEFRDEGCAYASLSGTPMANGGGRTVLGRATLAAVRRLARPGYDFEGLRHFKQKFNPVWEPLYLAHTGRFGLARAAAAIMGACSP